MATTTTNDTIDLKTRCLLVSDSDEIQTQMDSKQLPYTTLAEMAQDALFSRYLDMDQYLTVSEFNTTKMRLGDMYEDLDIPSTSGAKPKFRAVEGQVILLNATGVPKGVSPMDYALEHWDVSSEFQLTPIPNCMLRGVLLI